MVRFLPSQPFCRGAVRMDMLEIIPDVLEAKQPEIQEGLILEVADIFGSEPITIQDIKTLILASGQDAKAIEKAFAMAKQQTYINNLVGWMKKCLEERWYENEALPQFKGRTVEASQITLDLYQEYLDEREEQTQH